MVCFSDLLPDMVTEILARVPAESALDCKKVCKDWRSIVSHSSFWRKHLDHLKNNSDKLEFLGSDGSTNFLFQYDSHISKIIKLDFRNPSEQCDLVGSCNGLVCLACENPCYNNKISPIICNPITGEWIWLPEIDKNYENPSRFLHWSYGFGYLSSTKEYKVVGMYKGPANDVKVFMYVLGSGKGWTCVGKFDSHYIPKRDEDYRRHGVFVDETVYWLGSKTILSFDMSKESFCNTLSPLPFPSAGMFKNKIGVLDGMLYIAHANLDEREDFFSIWQLRKINNEKYWTFLCKVYESDEVLLSSIKSLGILVQANSSLKIYDTKTSTSCSLATFPGSTKYYHVQNPVIPHKNTLIPLKELGEPEIRRMPSATEYLRHEAKRLEKAAEQLKIEEAESHDTPLKQL